MKIFEWTSLTYDYISLLPNQISEIKHRSECDTSVSFLGITLNIPIIASPMNTVCGGKMRKKLSDLGCLGIVHRFNTPEEQLNKFFHSDLSYVDKNTWAGAVGLNSEMEFERLKKLANAGVKIICIDIANGGSKMIEKYLNKVQQVISEFKLKIIAGNVASYESTKYLIELGVDAIRVGIGNGAGCSTSIKSGIGIGQVDAIQRALIARNDLRSNIKIIADGGIINPGTFCKAIALGCDAVMMGRALAGTDESPGEIIKYNNQMWKRYYGSASFAAKQENKNYIEGEETLVPYRGSVSKIIKEYQEGLQSSMSYLNSKTIKEYQEKAEFVKLTSHAFNERKPQI